MTHRPGFGFHYRKLFSLIGEQPCKIKEIRTIIIEEDSVFGIRVLTSWEDRMIYRNTVVATLLLTVCALPVWSQEQSGSNGCNVESPEIKSAPQPRTKVKWIQGPDGKRTA